MCSVNPTQAVRDGSLVLLDADEALSQFMVNGQPDWDLFDSTVGASVREVQLRAAGFSLRAYGEMVGILWTQGRFSAAMVLEEFWNTVLESTEFRLFCAYPIDVFGKAFHRCDVDALLCSHSHMLPGEANGPLESALDRAMSEVLGSRARGVRDRIATEAQPAWASDLQAEARILWLRANLKEHADQILGWAQHYYYASAA
jgi:MEDS: MEthanogen/methylotroph, DcmR Sensory domain